MSGDITNNHITSQLPRYLHVEGRLSKKVTTGNVDETTLSGDDFDLVTSLLNIAKD